MRQNLINSGGNIGWAMRKNSPELKQIVDDFIRKHQKGTALGNILFKRYMENNKWARNALIIMAKQAGQSLLQPLYIMAACQSVYMAQGHCFPGL